MVITALVFCYLVLSGFFVNSDHTLAADGAPLEDKTGIAERVRGLCSKPLCSHTAVFCINVESDTVALRSQGCYHRCAGANKRVKHGVSVE